MDHALLILIFLIAVALLFDFLNGLHDAANSVATIVSTRVLPPRFAVAWAAFFNFIAFLFFGLHVAQTLGTGIVDAGIIDPRVIFSALMGAITEGRLPGEGCPLSANTWAAIEAIARNHPEAAAELINHAYDSFRTEYGAVG